ncbi:MAG: DUF2628 domain-containing protein [Clostridium sp.]|nr:DUF2628 domain-containing protein [Clostridium sp.]MCM1547306.1 DUF2628 domain-containing protein [Ruminococcus sp.]
MSKYLGHKCIVCEQKFDKNDDVVVCPECGTPYHRECYLKNGKCVNTKLHESGESYKYKVESGARENNSDCKKCPYCGEINKPHTLMCEKCGTPLVKDLNNINYNNQDKASENGGANTADPNGMYGTFSFNPNDKYCGMNPEEKFESVDLRDLADFVSSNQVYYLPIFKKIKDTGRKTSMNIVSFLFPELYFANRKMWLWTAVSIIVSTLLGIPAFIYLLASEGMIKETLGGINITSTSFELVCNILSWVTYGFKAIMLLFANWLYYRHAIGKIRQIKCKHEKVSPHALSAIGGTSIGGIFISFAIKTFLTMLIVYLLLI